MHHRSVTGISRCLSYITLTVAALLSPSAYSQNTPSLPAPVRSTHQERCADSAMCPDHAAMSEAVKRSIIVLKEPSVAELLEKHPSRISKSSVSTLSVEALYAGEVHAQALKRSHASAISTLSRHKVPVRATYSIVMNAIVVDKQITLEEASKLLPNKVLRVVPNNEVHVSLDTSVPLVKAPDVWQLLDTKGQNITGKGVRIGIIDTGIDYTHADLGGCSRTSNINKGSCAKVVGGYDFINKDNDPFDDHGHGTHCAATAAGKGTVAGVAPDATLYAYKVLSDAGYGTDSSIISAVERAADPNQDGNVNDHLDVISLSLGGPDGDPNDAMSLALDRAVSLGIVAVVAAGNAGSRSGSVSSPGTSRHAITVGARTKDGQLAYFSSRGPVTFTENKKTYTLTKPDVNAPGVFICAAASSGASPLGPTCRDSSHTNISGTSMATPHVAGVAALLKQAHPEWTALEIKSAIKRSASHATMQSYLSLNDEGTGTVDALAGAQQLRGEAFIEETSLQQTALELSVRVPVGLGYTLSVAKKPTLEGASNADWTTIATGTSTAPLSDIAISTTTLSQGAYLAKLAVRTSSGSTIADYTHFTIDRFALLSPQENDVINSHDPVVVELKNLFDSPIDSMVIEYSVNGSAFTSQGTSVNARSLFGTITLPPLTEKASLSVRTRVTTRGLEEVFTAGGVTIEPRLSAGFPIRAPHECGASYWGSSLCQPNWVVHPVVADLNADGTKEIIVWRNRAWPNANEMQIYNGAGSLIQTFPLSAHQLQSYLSHQQYSPRPPVVTDLEGDGDKEIIVVESFLDSWGANKEPTVVAVYDKNGKVRSGFPVLLNGPNDSIIVADLNRDGRKEIIVKNFSRVPGIGQSMTIIEPDGAVVADVQLKINSPLKTLTALDEGRDSLVGNFDDDTDLEVAVVSGLYDSLDIFTGDGYTAIYIVNWDQKGILETVVSPLVGMPFGGGASYDSDADGRHELTIPSTPFSKYSQSINYLVPALKPTTSSTSTFRTVQYLCPLASPATCGAYFTGTAIGRLKGETTPSVMAFAESANPSGTQLHLISGYSVRTGIGGLLTSKVASSAPVIRDVTGDGENDIIMSNELTVIPVESRGIVVLTSESNYTESLLLSTERNWGGSTGFSPTVTDIDNDGTLEVTYGTLGDGIESLPPNTASKKRFSIYSFDTQGQSSVSNGAWTMWRGNDDHNGCTDCDGAIVPSTEQAPVITEQPKAKTVREGTPFALHVSATGSELSYQWERAVGDPDSEYSAGWFPVAGATGTSLTDTTPYRGVYHYRVRISGKTRQTMSSVAVVTAVPEPAARSCPSNSPKVVWGTCGCNVLDEDTDSDGTIDCLERRPYRSLGIPTVTKLPGSPLRYRVVLPNTPAATLYTVTATHTPARAARRTVTKSSPRRTFILSELRRGTWEIGWSATVAGVPNLPTARGKSTSLTVR